MPSRSNSLPPYSGPPYPSHRRVASGSASSANNVAGLTSLSLSGSAAAASGSVAAVVPSVVAPVAPVAPVPAPAPLAAGPVGPVAPPAAATVRAETLPAKSTGTMNALLPLPRARDVTLRSGRSINWNRPVNQEAVLAYTRGQVAASSCRSCVGGAGPCVECVVVPGSLKESCTNCHYASEGARCSFRAVSASPAPPAGRPRSRRPPGPPPASSSRASSSAARGGDTLRRLAETHRTLADLYEERAEEEDTEEEVEDENSDG